MGLSSDPEQREKQLANLKPFTGPDDPRINRGGKKGVRNWSTIIKKLLDDEQLLDKVVTKKPSYWEELPEKNAATAIGMAMIIKALGGDQKAADWLRKTGFGEKFMHDIEGGLFQSGRLEVEIVRSSTSVRKSLWVVRQGVQRV